MPTKNTDSLKLERTTLQAAFDSEYDVVQTIMEHEVNDDQLTEIEARLEEMKEVYETECLLNDKIKNQLKDDELELEVKSSTSRRSEERIKLLKVKKFLEKQSTSQQEQAPTPSEIKTKTAQLPKLRLPTFDGSFTKWTSFWDTMTADVLSGNYSEITKFNYIVGQLEGTAAEAVKGLHASGSNLTTLTEVLTDRFGQPRKITRAHVCNIYDTLSPTHNYAELSRFYNQINGDLRSLKHMGVDTDVCAPFIVPLIERKLPKKLQEKMGTSGQGDQFNLKKFMSAFVEQLENLGEQFGDQDLSGNLSDRVNTVEAFVSTTANKFGCLICNGNHKATDCNLSAYEKLNAVRSKRLCYNCLRGHQVKTCSNRGSCRICQAKHHTCLHDCLKRPPETGSNIGGTTTGACVTTPVVEGDRNEIAKTKIGDRRLNTYDDDDVETDTRDFPQSSTVECNVGNLDSNTILLETGQVTLDNKGTLKTVGLLVDRGSMLSYIRSDVVTSLGLKPRAIRTLYVNGFGGNVSKRDYGVVKVGVVTEDGTKYLEVLVTDEIVKPIKRVGWSDCKKYGYIANLKLADNFRDSEFKVELLIGCDYAYEFLQTRMIFGDGPTVQYSNIGCFLSGPMTAPMTGNKQTCTHAAVSEQHVVTDVPRNAVTSNGYDYDARELDDEKLEMYTKSWTLDTSEKNDSEYDLSFKQQYIDAIQFKNGQYYVPLPWKIDHPELSTNIETCRSRLRQVIPRLKKLNLTDAYVQVMAENIQKGYVSEIVNGEEAMKERDSHFIPHFPVLRDSETTPVRIVFDASCGSPSLNDCLHEGPNMIQDLSKLLFLFRAKKFALTADIARAFLNVKLIEPERKYVRFLWYRDNDLNKEIVPYSCNTVIFGNVSSPFALAVTLEKHLDKYAHSHVAQDVARKLYVDNLLTGVNTESEAENYYKESREIMKHGTFNLRQWATNAEILNKRIMRDDSHTKSELVTILGLKWDPRNDVITIARKDLTAESTLTKRMVVSQTSTTFDPLGLVGPLIVPAKVFINTLWTNDKLWDETLTSDEMNEWTNIRESIGRASEFKLSRWLQFDSKDQMEIVVFCDACPRVAIGCVAYGKQGDKTALLGSKNKVVSKKNNQFTVPRLELQAMLMGAQFAKMLQDTYGKEFPNIEITYATDSEIALHWLKSDKKLKLFVNNRVKGIRDLSDVNKWFHVTTKENMADILSRGTTYQELVQSKWKDGPDWLKFGKETWPLTPVGRDNVTILAAAVELHHDFQVPNVTTPANIGNVIDISRYSTYRKVLRITALVTRAFKGGLKQVRNLLSADDVNNAEKLWIRHVQKTEYNDVIEYLTAEKINKRSLPTKPAVINQLGLIIDDEIVRCGGRLSNANVHFDKKCPILLPNNSHLSILIISNCHHKMAHYGVGSTMNEIRKRFWITSLRSLTKKVLRKCVICKKVTGRPYLKPTVAQLPSFRLNNLKPFEATAMDFTAHLYVKNESITKKAYLCLFTCCTTRAVELEIVPDLSVISFIRAFRRFTSTFSTPSLLYCDNAKTFTSSQIELNRMYKNATSIRFQDHLADSRIKFVYTPVQASWFGGVHERLIGVCKNAIKKTLGKSLVAMDELQTTIKEIQAVVNSRPLTYMSSDVNEFEPLTPNHLIYGHDLTLIPCENIEDVYDPSYGGKSDLEKLSFRRSQLIENFRKRFYTEYLATLRERHAYEVAKQSTKKNIIERGDVVIVFDKDLPRVQWKLGVVQRVHIGQDDMIRSAAVRTSSGISNRAIARLYPLEINVGEERGNVTQDNPDSSNVRRPQRRAAEIAKQRIKGQIRHLTVDSD